MVKCQVGCKATSDFGEFQHRHWNADLKEKAVGTNQSEIIDKLESLRQLWCRLVPVTNGFLAILELDCREGKWGIDHETCLYDLQKLTFTFLRDLAAKMENERNPLHRYLSNYKSISEGLKIPDEDFGISGEPH